MKLPKYLSVGNRVLDSKHNNLYSMINKVAYLIATRNMAALLEAFDLLENCLCDYFSVEESIARAIDFDFTRHELAHRQLLGRYKQIKAELIAKNGTWTKFEENGYIESMKSYLRWHIKEDGKPLKAVLETHYYDFKLYD